MEESMRARLIAAEKRLQEIDEELSRLSENPPSDEGNNDTGSHVIEIK